MNQTLKLLFQSDSEHVELSVVRDRGYGLVHTRHFPLFLKAEPIPLTGMHHGRLQIETQPYYRRQ